MMRNKITLKMAVAKMDAINDILFDFSCGKIKDMNSVIKKQCQSIEIHLMAKKRSSEMIYGLRG